MCGDGANDCGVSENSLQYIYFKNECSASRIPQTEHMLEMGALYLFIEQFPCH